MVKQVLRMCLPALICAVGAQATTVSFVTPSGSSTGGGAVDAFVNFDINSTADTITITLQDLEANPTDVAQLLSDVDFVLSTGQTVGTLSSSSAQEISVAGTTGTLGSTMSTGWGVNDNVNGGIQLDAIGFIGPAHLIIGPPSGANTYSNANGSISGNSAHNPFLSQTATFVLDVSGITPATTVSSAAFSFGTTAGVDVQGAPSSSVPEPAPYLLVGGGLLALGLCRKKLARS